MQRSRFVFLAMPLSADGPATEGILWMLVSPNNRPLGRGAGYHETYAGCRAAVLDLQARYALVRCVESTVEVTGQWTWRVDLDGATVATSSRSYLRARECTYNLECFLSALPAAELVAGTRSVRRGRRRAAEPEPPVRQGLRDAG